MSAVIMLSAFLLFGPQQPGEASLRVKTDVTQVQVLLDSKEMGETPLTLRSLEPGPHRVMLIKAGDRKSVV